MSQPTTTVSSSNSLPNTIVPSMFDQLIPKPISAVANGESFTLRSTTTIIVTDDQAVQTIGSALATYLNRITPLAITTRQGSPQRGDIVLTLNPNLASELGNEGYEITITVDQLVVEALAPAGLFRALQTIRQLLPTQTPSQFVTLSGGHIRDYPRFAYRGAMLDVARHFFSVNDVKRYIDLIAYYKINTLHLHLSDDQGWRIMIDQWERLALYGGGTEVGNGQGGYYTKTDYAEIVNYATHHYITVIPEIDMPGHTNAALASYPELTCDGVAPQRYTGIEVGFSTLCLSKESTYTFIDQVIGELAAMTPGEYIHIGGDESKVTAHDEYLVFVERIQQIVASHGKKAIGWEEIGQGKLMPSTVVQYWFNRDHLHHAIAQHAKIIMSPADKSYLDMKYHEQSPLGYSWAGYTEVKDAYDWNPIPDEVESSAIWGVEAPLWSETLQTMSDIEYQAFPRLLGIAEIGWSSPTGRNWEEYRQRLATHGARLTALGVNFYRSPQVDWQ